MRLLNLEGRPALAVAGGGAIDVATASGDRFGPGFASVYERWDDFRAWASTVERGAHPVVAVDDDDLLGPPVPRPSQVFAIGLNYLAHVAEGGSALPEQPMVFTKFPASVTGPHDDIEVPTGSVDYEVELVVVVGRWTHKITPDRAWAHVAGLTAGQDLSERELQIHGPAPQQHNLAKSHTGFSPIGPALVTPDEFADPDDIGLRTVLNGVEVQSGRTSDMVFGVAELISYLSGFLPLLPGDLVFTGTPAGIGWTRDPKLLLGPGDELVTEVEGIGEMRNRFVAGSPAPVWKEADRAVV
ncbi:fumarylacetoacetate hydrolase family protein [Pseudonocardia benzenivorans]|uniref:Fumarylacetoacetate hydrolase family protein n=1 Tax=Pseudonocardia benzenivorans TaxID=228005 RepID=A0ABW3VCS2_9PSEU